MCIQAKSGVVGSKEKDALILHRIKDCQYSFRALCALRLFLKQLFNRQTEKCCCLKIQKTKKLFSTAHSKIWKAVFWQLYHFFKTMLIALLISKWRVEGLDLTVIQKFRKLINILSITTFKLKLEISALWLLMYNVHVSGLKNSILSYWGQIKDKCIATL